MSVETVRILTNKNSMLAYMRQFTPDQLTEMLNKMADVTEQVKQEKLVELARAEEKKQKLADFAEKLKADGISIEDLLGVSGKTIKAEQQVRKTTLVDGRSIVPQKYKYRTVEGEHKTWSGRGIAPREIRSALDSGASLASFLIDKDE